MAELTRSQVAAFKKETTEGTLQALTAGSDFVKLREGFTISGNVDVVDSDELINDIGKAKSLVTGESPSGSWPGYFRHSGVEGQQPEWGILMESAFGSVAVNGSEESTIAGSTTSLIKVGVGVGANFAVGEGLLVKDGTNGWSIRCIKSIAGDDLTLNFALANAPASGVALGKCVHYAPVASGHPTFSAYRYQAATSSSYKDAVSGCRTTSLNVEFPAKDLASVTAEFEGLEYFSNYFVVDATNDSIDFKDAAAGGELSVVVEQKTYKDPIELATEISNKMTAGSANTITCSYDNTLGKFTIATSGAELELLSNTGTNVATSIWSLIGYSVAADKTGATTYTAGSAISLDAPFTPSLDVSDPQVVRSHEFLLGDSIVCRNASNVSFSISTPKTDVNDICASTGKSATLTLEREATLTGTLILNQYESELFNKFINNTNTPVQYASGPKSGGNFQAGLSSVVYMPNASITAMPVADQDGYMVYNLEMKGYITSSEKDIHLGWL